MSLEIERGYKRRLVKVGEKPRESFRGGKEDLEEDRERSEERRVGKECRSRRRPDHKKKNMHGHSSTYYSE